MTTVVVSFPGSGRTDSSKRLKLIDVDFKLIELDDYKGDESYPANMVEDVVDMIKSRKHKLFLLPSDSDLMDGLVANKIKFIIFCPHMKLKDEYIKRLREQEGKEDIINYLDQHWEDVIKATNGFANNNFKLVAMIELSERNEKLYEALLAQRIVRNPRAAT